MDVFEIEPDIIILKGTKDAEPKYRREVSASIIEKFGKGPFPADIIQKILYFCQSYYVEQFERCVNAEISFTFFKEVFVMNEMAAHLRRSPHFFSLPSGLDKSYIAGYRRILKMILEQACSIQMVAGEKRDRNFIRRISPVMNNLLYLGHMIGCITESISEQAMVEDISDISFDENDLFVQSRRHHYEAVIEKISGDMESMTDNFIIDQNASEDFKIAIQQSFGFNPEKLAELLASLHHHFELEPPCCLAAEINNFLRDAAAFAGVSIKSMKSYLDGLTLQLDNKMNLAELIKRPHSIDRFLYRPILVWNINGEEFYVLGLFSFNEAENSLLLNAIPWGKFPAEWAGLKIFKSYVNRKKDEHDKWLDDVVEKIIIERGLLYDRGVNKIHNKVRSYSITGKGLGELDFLIICPASKKLLIAECKHLLGRYDMVNWKNDFDHFVTDGKAPSYNTRLTNKLSWLSQNIEKVEEHFRLKYKTNDIDLRGYKVEGIFVINTPTFYMHNALYRIYTYHCFGDVLTGNHEDPVFDLLYETDEEVIMYQIKYPYFRKPTLITFDAGDDDYEVDKYGYPIK